MTINSLPVHNTRKPYRTRTHNKTLPLRVPLKKILLGTLMESNSLHALAQFKTFYSVDKERLYRKRGKF